jgi:hypothetical protein
MFPANSFGYMDSGIDFVLNKMFSGVEYIVQARVASLHLKPPLGSKALNTQSAKVLKRNFSTIK